MSVIAVVVYVKMSTSNDTGVVPAEDADLISTVSGNDDEVILTGDRLLLTLQTREKSLRKSCWVPVY